ncbi:hypothetical protein Pla175_02500 [Pirellulimonas nuda]|uniref:Uncharacterized protein n=1 Tax=Pirellulimonas nuda TaxID=2528009 RepID=A0A518D5Z8_9BACT|nr:hypothetical protein [Pirellulimonas nuda]QDU86896.1 hypothetical protein Pla175_02500 [Pirellulimonas nuda]
MDPPLSIYAPLDWDDIDWDLVLPEDPPEPDLRDFCVDDADAG